MNITSRVLQKNLQEVNLITDGLGLPIDEEIKFPVAVLRSLHFVTTSSCSGHLTGQTPYIQISSQAALNFENDREVEDVVNLLRKEPFDEATQKKYQVLCTPVKQANQLEGQRLLQFVEDFYKTRSTDESTRLILESIGDGLGGYRIFPQGSVFTQLKKKKELADWLKKSQDELQSFAEFLCDKIEDNEDTGR